MSKSSLQPLIEFDPKLPKLSKNEKQVLGLLIEAGRLIAPLYGLQNDPNSPGGNFYPADVIREDVIRAATHDSEILSPYTIVERVKGKLVAVPYHIKYASMLEPIAQKLQKAAEITENKEFGRALMVQAKALLDGSYEKAAAAWLSMKPYILDISIGPNDYFDDQLLFTKNSYQAWVGVVEKEGTERLNNYKETILSARRKGLMPTEIVSNYDRVKAKVLDTVLLSGLLAKTRFQGVNYPVNIDFVEKYGSEITLFNQPNDLLMKERVMPAFNKIFSKEFREGYTEEDLRRANLRYTAMHELAHSYLYYRDASENLKDLFRSIYELAATLLGLRMAGYLMLKDRINAKQLESMIVALICTNYYLVEQKSDKFLPEYKLGATLFINFLLKSGALNVTKGKMVINFLKISVALQDLFHILERLLSKGTRKEAAAFIEEYIK